VAEAVVETAVDTAAVDTAAAVAAVGSPNQSKLQKALANRRGFFVSKFVPVGCDVAPRFTKCELQNGNLKYKIS